MLSYISTYYKAITFRMVFMLLAVNVYAVILNGQTKVDNSMEHINQSKEENLDGIESSQINQSWAGLFQPGSNIRPPDPHGCAGPNGIIQVVNLRIAYWTKNGNPNWGDTIGGAGNFFPSANPINNELRHPRALFDHNTQRFYVIIQENGDSEAFLNLAVSKDKDPSTASYAEWWFYRFNVTLTVDPNNYGIDYPGFGFDGQAIYSTYNTYLLPPPFPVLSVNSQILIVHKDSAVTGTLNYFRRVLTPGFSFYSGFSLQPGTVLSPTGPVNKAYFGEICAASDDSIRIWVLKNPITTPALSSYKMQVPNNGGFIATNAPQLGTAITIPTLSPRTQGNAFWINGALWFCNTAGGNSGRAKVYYYKVFTNDFADADPTLAETGAIDGGNGVWTFQPSIGANLRGDVCMVYTESSALKYPEIKFVTRKAVSGTWDPPKVLKSSPNYSNSDGWGAYASVTHDPLDSTIWVTHEWSRSNGLNDWGTWWGNIILPTTLQITLIPEGFYDAGLNRLNTKDTVKAYLNSTVAPYAKIDSAKGVLDSQIFTAKFDFYKVPSGTFYISLNHRNCIETWSKTGGEVISKGGIISYNFTDSQSKAFGNNQKMKGTKWCIINGDTNQDDFIDGSDYLEIVNNWEAGGPAMAGDTNGDYFIDGSDYLQIVNNFEVGAITPLSLVKKTKVSIMPSINRDE